MLAGAEEDKQRETQSKAGFNAVVYEEEARFNRVFSAGDRQRSGRRAAGGSPFPGYVSAFEVTPDGSQGNHPERADAVSR